MALTVTDLMTKVQSNTGTQNPCFSAQIQIVLFDAIGKTYVGIHALLTQFQDTTRMLQMGGL